MKSGKIGKSSLLVLFLTLLSTMSYSQGAFSKEVEFVDYLVSHKEYRSAIKVLNDLGPSLDGFNHSQVDTINYYLGWSYYNEKSLDSSIAFLDLVSANSGYSDKAQFYSIFNHIYLGRVEKGQAELEGLELEGNMHQLRLLQLSGIALLQRNYTAFDSLYEQFDFSYFPIAEEQKQILAYRSDLMQIKDRKAWKAGLISMVFPGGGKFYSGYFFKGMSTFLQTTVMGAVAAEHYLKAGPKSPQFILFASIFSVIYLGNVWGSALSADLKKKERYGALDRRILYDLHIPLRRVFN